MRDVSTALDMTRVIAWCTPRLAEILRRASSENRSLPLVYYNDFEVFFLVLDEHTKLSLIPALSESRNCSCQR